MGIGHKRHTRVAGRTRRGGGTTPQPASGRPRQAKPEPQRGAQDLIEVLPVPVFFKSRDGTYLGVNKAWEDFFGVPRARFVGKAVHDLYPQSPEVADKHHAMDEELWARPGSQRYEIAVKTPDGRVRHTIYCKATYTREDGEVAGLIGAIIDITERKDLERRFREIFEQAAVGLTQVTLDGVLLDFNQKFCDMLGYSRDELLGKSVQDVTHPGDYTQGSQFRSQLASRTAPATAMSGEKRYMRKDGSLMWGRRTMSSALDDAGKPQYVISVVEDVTERKHAETALREAHDEMARQAQELKRSNAELEQFAYVSSHDLQEPLRMISSYTQLLLRRYGDRFEGESREFMDFIVDGATRMKQLIEDILAYSRIGTRGHEFQAMECDEALGKAVTNLRAAIESSGATVTHDPLPRVEADSAQIVQLFQNLIGNALKFRGTQPPRIHVGVAERPGAFEFAVSDNGIGIDARYFERIFMLFQRLHGKDEYSGTGIGLAICQKVVDRHGGRLWVESQPGAGSTFFFTLPTRGAAHGRTGAAGAAG